MSYDVFISHASEDKEGVARPLATQLQQMGLRVWLDEFELTLGDSLRRKIDRGLSDSRFGIVVLSPAFFGKEWPNKELDGLVSREDGSGKVILPVWHNISVQDIIRFSPMLADKVAVSTSRGIPYVASSVFNAVQSGRSDIARPVPSPVDAEAEALDRIRRAALLSPSSQELRRAMYELDSVLARNPHSPEARDLKYRLEEALDRAMSYERPATVGASVERGSEPSRAAPSGLLIGAVLVVAIAVVYWLLHVLGVV